MKKTKIISEYELQTDPYIIKCESDGLLPFTFLGIQHKPNTPIIVRRDPMTDSLVIKYDEIDGLDPNDVCDHNCFRVQQAVLQGDIETVRAKLHKVNIHYSNDKLLLLAAQSGQLEIFKLLLAAGADIHASEYFAQEAEINGHKKLAKFIKKILKKDRKKKRLSGDIVNKK